MKTAMLKKNYEFKDVLTRGKKYRGQYIDIYIVKNNLEENRLGIAVSSKIANSVGRNKIKRIIRENYRRNETKIPIGNNIVILWKKNRKVEELSFKNIEQDINTFLKNVI